MDQSERAELVRFLDETQELLRWVIHDRRSALPSYLRNPLLDAWGVTRGRFARLREFISSGELDVGLDEHGLSGPELVAKLVAFRVPFQAWDRRRQRRMRSERRSGRDLTGEGEMA